MFWSNRGATMRHCRAFQKLVIAERVCMSKEITKTTMQVALSRPTVGLASKPTLSCHSKETGLAQRRDDDANVGRVWKWIPDNLLTVQTLEVLHEECKPAPLKKNAWWLCSPPWVVNRPNHSLPQENHEKTMKNQVKVKNCSELWHVKPWYLWPWGPEQLSDFRTLALPVLVPVPSRSPPPSAHPHHQQVDGDDHLHQHDIPGPPMAPRTSVLL